MIKKYSKKWVIAAITFGIIIILTVPFVFFLFQQQDTSDIKSIPPLYPGTEWKAATNSSNVHYTSLVKIEELDNIVSYYQTHLKTMQWQGGKLPQVQGKVQTQSASEEYMYIKLKYPKLQSVTLPDGLCRSLITCEGIRYFSLSYEYSTQDSHNDTASVTIEYY